MTLAKQIEARRQKIHTDGYPMSVGELITIYRDGELNIYPEFQRFFRWTVYQKSRLIESILLGIPLPSIFVSQRKDGVWDVVDGLQRLSTILEVAGELVDERAIKQAPLPLVATKFLPALEGKRWSTDDDDPNGLGRDVQLFIKRTKIDVKIVLKESDGASKFELFQRLNTGGSPLTPQEVRNCLVLMTSKPFFAWMKRLADDPNFKECTALSARQKDEQYDLELITRFLVFRRETAGNRLNGYDLGTYLDEQIAELAASNIDLGAEEAHFKKTFECINKDLGADAFRRYKDPKFVGQFLISAFEVLAISFPESNQPKNLRVKAIGMWSNETFLDGIGSGVSADARMKVTLPFGRKLYKGRGA